MFSSKHILKNLLFLVGSHSENVWAATSWLAARAKAAAVAVNLMMTMKMSDQTSATQFRAKRVQMI